MDERKSIFGRPPRGTRGPAPRHSREAIVAAAVEIADRDGLTAVSMRAVAGALGTGAGSLYRYLASREDLLDLMGDAVTAELRPFPAAAAPVDALVALARRQLALYRRHEWMVEVIRRTSSPGPHALTYFDHCLGVLAPLGLPAQRQFEAIAMLTGVVSLFAQPPSGGFTFGDITDYPHLVEALTASSPAAPPDGPDLFERTVRSLLVGLLTG